MTEYNAERTYCGDGINKAQVVEHARNRVNTSLGGDRRFLDSLQETTGVTLPQELYTKAAENERKRQKLLDAEKKEGLGSRIA